MQVILLERVAKLGQMGDVVDVKNGYARNYLLPQGKALSASKANIETFENQKAQLEARNLESKKEAEDLAARLNGRQFVVIRSASDAGALYGSVTTRDTADVATQDGYSLDRKQVVIPRPIKELGLHEVSVVLHPEVEAVIALNVARSIEEAELQASGKSIQELAAEAEAEAEFEIAELFEDIGAAGLEDDEGPSSGDAPEEAESTDED
ncbi:MAG: 50S ribosomal protein L9 [Dinoroseobacter sp.]|nr:50S ribosomal protein L9 [Dinoroseobacter sp.]